MTFEERNNKFRQEVEILQKKYNIQLYAADVLLQNGEITTLIKLRDLLPQDQVIDSKLYADNSKKGDSINKKT